MMARALWFAAGLLAPAALGWWLHGLAGALAGALLASMVFWAAEAWAMARVLRWLRTEQVSESSPSASPLDTGAWADLADRVRRLLRNRDRAQQESQTRLQEFLSALQASPNGVMLLDAQGRIEWCNTTAAQHFGIEPARDLMQYAANLIREPAFTRYLALGDFSSEVLIAGRLSTPARPVTLSVHVHPYGGERKLLLSRDITALEQAEAMRRDFVANVSHEIRTPLTVLAGFVETLQTLQLTDEERQRYLGLMAQQSSRMQTLVSDLLTLSRLEGSPLPGHEWVGVQGLMAQCRAEALALSASLALKAPADGHALTFEAALASEVAGSQTELYSALSNLVNNALRYTPAPGAVTVRWRVLADGRGEFSVQDHGPGIAPEHLPRLTERFYRLDRSRSRDTGGTGLGLAIVKHVAQRHGAELLIESQLGQGSRFVVLLPANRVRAVQATLPPAAPASPAA